MKKINLKILKHNVRNPDTLAILALFIVCLLFFARLFFPIPKIFSTAEIGINDIWYLNFPLKNFLSENLKQGQLPLWDPYRNGGFPDLAEGQIGTFNLYNLVAFRFLPAIYAFNIGFIVMFFQCALGIYLFTRHKGFQPFFSFYMAFIYAFSGFFVTHISHYALLQTASFFPLLLFSADLILHRKKLVYIVFFAFILSQQLFSGFPQMLFISLIGISIYALFLLARSRIWKLQVLRLCLAILTGLILSMVQLLPSLELIPMSNRATGLDSQETLFYKFPVKHLLTFINPFAFGNPQQGTYPHFKDFEGSLFWENSGYFGIIPLILALVALMKIKKIKEWKVYVTLTGISFLLMLGGGSPFYILFTYPPFSFFRFPSRFLLIFVFGLVILSGYGFQYIYTVLIKKKKRLAAFFICLAVCLSIWDLTRIWLFYHPVVPFSEYEKIPESAKIIKKTSVGKIYTYQQNSRAWEEFFNSGSTRWDRYLELKNELAPNLNLLYRLESADAYASSLTPRRLAQYNSFLRSEYKITTSSSELKVLQKNLLDMRSTTHIISPVVLTNKSLTQIAAIGLEKFNLPASLYIYKNREAVPRYYPTNSIRNITTVEEFVSVMSSEDFKPLNEALVEKKIETISALFPLIQTTEIIKETASLTELNVETNQPALLISTRSYYPGWIAYVDDKKTEVMPVNLVNQGIIIPQGKHIVKFLFQPKLYQIGLYISLLAYLGLGFYLLSIIKLDIIQRLIERIRSII